MRMLALCGLLLASGCDDPEAQTKALDGLTCTGRNLAAFGVEQ